LILGSSRSFREREWEQRQDEIRHHEESEKKQKQTEERERAAKGARAFRKMIEKAEADPDHPDAVLCRRWNAYTTDPANIARRDELAKIPGFLDLYYAAFYADRVPGKRKAMKAFLDFAEKVNLETETEKDGIEKTEKEVEIGA
jgi:hypothetical protein